MEDTFIVKNVYVSENYLTHIFTQTGLTDFLLLNEPIMSFTNLEIMTSMYNDKKPLKLFRVDP